MPNWAQWIGFIILVGATYTAGILWASEAHTEAKASIESNRARLDDSADDLKRIEQKLDTLIMHLVP
jgi:hypothetical protein